MRGGGQAQGAGFLVALFGAFLALWQINDRLADPTAPRHAAPVPMSAELRATGYYDPAAATEAETAQFRAACEVHRLQRTEVRGSGWRMNDLDATTAMCACVERSLSGRASRLEWLYYLAGERREWQGERAAVARIEALGKSPADREAIVKVWRSRRDVVLRDCRR